MTSAPPCGCCSPVCCHECMPSCAASTICSPSPCGKLKADPQNKKQPVCSYKNCEIFGGHDTTPFPEYPCPARRIKSKNANLNSLGSPIGLVTSNVNFKTEETPTDRTQARYATYLKAFARLHLNAETTWTSMLIDDIMKEGLLLNKSSEKEEKKLESPADIYTSSESNVLREFEMGGCNFQVELMPKFKLNTSEKAEIGANGDGNTNALILEDLKPTLKSFFRQHTYCLLVVGSFYVMIWRSKDVYFVFDVCGRRITDFKRDTENGVAMLMCLNTLENVRHLLINLSALRKMDPICLREMKIVKVTTTSGNVMRRDYGIRTHQYQVVNDDYAYLKAGLHLTLNKSDLLRNRSALPVGVAAIVISKIDHPATWNTKLLDKIVCFGVNFCQACWINCVVNEPIDVTEFPCQFNIGQFRITTELVARKYEGIWRCVPGFRYSQLAETIEKAFDVDDQKLLLQINYQMYAIWKKDGFIYLFDPYRHRILGKEDESEVYKQMEKSATVRMFRSFEVFMNTFNHILLDSNRTNQFYLHVLKIQNIQHVNMKDVKAVPDEEAKLDRDGEVISINEHICLDEAEDLCQKALGEISDYEDEDLKSDVDEMELKTSSSESEDIMEEEAGIGEAEEMEGLESSSSGEEGGGHKKKEKRGKGAKGGKGVGKGRKSSKEDRHKDTKRGKGGKGKEARDKEFGKKRNKNHDDDESSDDEGIQKINKSTNDGETGKKDRDHKNIGHDSTKDIKGKDKVDKDKEGKNKDHGSENKEKDGKGIDEDKNKDVNKKDLSKGDKDKTDHSKEKGKDVINNYNNGKGKEGKNEDKRKDSDKNNKGLSKEINTDQDIKELNKKGDSDTTEISKVGGKDKFEKDKDKDTKIDANRYENKDTNRTKAQDTEKGKNKDKDVGKGKDKDKNVDNDKDKNKHNDKDIYKDKNKDEDKDGDNDKDIYNHKDKNKDDDNDTYKDKEKNKDKDKDKYNDKENDSTINGLTEGKSVNDKDVRELNHPKLHPDGTEADDENEDNFIKESKRYCSGPNPNSYPGYFKFPLDMAVVGSESGSYESFCKLFQSGFKVSDRVLTLTPWGNFIVFRCLGQIGLEEKYYFLFDGCTCNINRFRHLDLSIGTAGLICFKHMHNVIEYIRRIRKIKTSEKQQGLRKYTADDICSQYCS